MVTENRIIADMNSALRDGRKRMTTGQKPPIFILGNRRSGTTMLRLMLTSHPNIVIPPEGGFIVALGWQFDRNITNSSLDVHLFIDKLMDMDTAQDWELNRGKLQHNLQMLIPCTFPELVDGVYSEFIQQNFPQKVRWGDKTTWYCDFLNQINQYFPEAQFIHIIRDGRAVAASYKHVPHLSKNIKEIALEWAWNINQITRFGTSISPSRYFEVRYEDLVNDPEGELKRICVYLQETYDEEMLDFWFKNRQLGLEPERHLGWKELTLQKVTRNQVFMWQSELTDHELKIFQAIAGRLLDKYGYDYKEANLKLRDQISVTFLAGRFSGRKLLRQKFRPCLVRLTSHVKKLMKSMQT